MARPLNEHVIVLTGASSGIGRATALRLGARGASLVLAARNEQALRDVAAEIERYGGRAEVVPTDVADNAQVERLADVAVERFGRIDTWVNDAGVSVYGTVDNLELDEIERVLQVNLFGPIYGMKAALRHMRPRGEGAIINVGSGFSERAVPLQAPYCASKHGLKGFTDALRMELAAAGSGITVTHILPASINTPFFEHARAKLDGQAAKPIPPVYQPESVAEAIVSAVERPQRDIYVGLPSRMLALGEALIPGLLDHYMTQNGRMLKQQTADKLDNGRDNLFTPSAGPLGPRAEWNTLTQPMSLYTRFAELPPSRRTALVGAAALGALLLAWRTA